MHMACDDYNELERRLNQAKQPYAQFLLSNVQLGADIQERREAQGEWEEIGMQIAEHVISCE